MVPPQAPPGSRGNRPRTHSEAMTRLAVSRQESPIKSKPSSGSQDSLTSLGLQHSSWERTRQSGEQSTTTSSSTEDSRASTSGELARSSLRAGLSEDVHLSMGSAETLQAWYALLQAFAASHRARPIVERSPQFPASSPASPQVPYFRHRSASTPAEAYARCDGSSASSNASHSDSRPWSRTVLQDLEYTETAAGEGDVLSCDM